MRNNKPETTEPAEASPGVVGHSLAAYCGSSKPADTRRLRFGSNAN